MVYNRPWSPFRTVLPLLACILLKHRALADVFLHSPRGSNNRMTETTPGAVNPNRLFHSDNDPAGGYNIGDNCVPNCKTQSNAYDAKKAGSQEGQMYFYTGSELHIEWTANNACGSPAKNTECQVILQYMCGSWSGNRRPGAAPLRDGKDPDSNTRRRTGGGNTPTPQGATLASADDMGRGRHESFEFYNNCRKRLRNQGLYNAGLQLSTNVGAAATRQNRNGARFGFECPEERDYYPYWHPTEWKDIAIFASDAGKRCPFYKQESQNVKPKGYCQSDKLDPQNPDATLNENEQISNTQETCVGGLRQAWIEAPAWEEDPPDCFALPQVTDNLHGNLPTGKPQSYMWKIPETIPDNDTCVLRVRYNVTAGDKPGTQGTQGQDPDDDVEFDYFFDLDARFNMLGMQPFATDAKQDFIGFGWNVAGPLQVQVDNAHWGRTFEDRSHTFAIRTRPSTLAEDVRIVNYNVRGKRGNIVQVYPAVTYEFVPPELIVDQGTFLHFQWAGSDSNPNNHLGHGKLGTDRTNLVQIESRATNKPVRADKHTLFFDGAKASEFTCSAGKITQTCNGNLFSSSSCGRCVQDGANLVSKLAFLDQQSYALAAGTTCPATPAQAAQKNDQADDNCHQLNFAPAYFDGGLVEMTVKGVHHIASTRNNDFSTASHKQTITVLSRNVNWLQVVLLVVIMIILVLASYQIGIAVYAYSHPTSDMFSRKRRPTLLKLPFLRWAVRRKEEQRRLYKKALQDAWKDHLANQIKLGIRKPTGHKTLAPLVEEKEKGVANEKAVADASAIQEAARGKKKEAKIEKRIDPEDGQTRTFEDLSAVYKDQCTEEELKEYWEHCTPAKSVSPEENAELAQPPDWLDLAKKDQQRCGWFRRLHVRCAGWFICFREENIFTFLFIGINILTAVIGFLRNWDGGFNRWFVMAKVGGYLLDFNLACILIPTLRTVHSCARPVHALDGLFNEDPIHFHIRCAALVAFSAAVHVTGHVVHIAWIVDGPVYQPAISAKQKFSGMTPQQLLFNPDNRLAGFTGILITYLMSAMFMSGLTHVRRHTFDFSKLPRTLREVQSWLLLLGAATLFSPFWLPTSIWRLARRRTFKGCLPGEGGKLDGFLVFWTIHKSWMPVFLLLMVHGPNCWIWFMWPLAMVLCDRLIRYERRKMSVLLRSAELLKGKVLRLTFTPPPGFIYQAGMYVLLNCSAVNAEEWHPFTLTSSPEENFVSVHIRCPDELDWCSAMRRRLVEMPAKAISKDGVEPSAFRSSRVKVLYNAYTCEALFDPLSDSANSCKDDTLLSRPWRVEIYGKGEQLTTFEMLCDDQKDADIEHAASLMEIGGSQPSERHIKTEHSKFTLDDIIKPQWPKDVIRMGIDGAHGAPSELVWRHRVVVLVGAGIGVTPFASILRSVTLRAPTKAELLAGSATDRKTALLKSSGSQLDQGAVAGQEEVAVEWKPCEHVHFYWLCRSQDEFEWFYDLLVSAVSQASENQIEINLFKTGETELSTVKSLGQGFREFFGRPNWKRIFPKLAETYPQEHVGCFYCGPPALRGDLSSGCRDATNSNKFGTKFTLHAENF